MWRSSSHAGFRHQTHPAGRSTNRRFYTFRHAYHSDNSYSDAAGFIPGGNSGGDLDARCYQDSFANKTASGPGHVTAYPGANVYPATNVCPGANVYPATNVCPGANVYPATDAYPKSIGHTSAGAHIDRWPQWKLHQPGVGHAQQRRLRYRPRCLPDRGRPDGYL